MGATFLCDVSGCDAAFSRSYQLKKHRVWHEDKSSCDWEGCKFYSETRKNLKIHFKGHTGVKDLVCTDTVTIPGKPGLPDTVKKCTFKTNDPSVFWKHRVKVHGHVPTRSGRPRIGTFEFIHYDSPPTLGNADTMVLPASGSSTSRGRKQKPVTQLKSSLGHAARSTTDSGGSLGEISFENTFPSTFHGQAPTMSPRANGSNTVHLQNHSISVITAYGRTRADHLEENALVTHAPFNTAEQSANIRLPYSSSLGAGITSPLDPYHWQFVSPSPPTAFQLELDSGRATERRFASWEISPSGTSDHSSNDSGDHVEDGFPPCISTQTPPSSVCSERAQTFAELPQEAPVAFFPMNPLQQPVDVEGFSSGGSLGTGIMPSVHPHHLPACDTTTHSQVEWHVDHTAEHAFWQTTSFSNNSSDRYSAEHVVPQYFSPQTVAGGFGRSPVPNYLDVSGSSNIKSVTYNGFSQLLEPQLHPAGFEDSVSVVPMVPPVDLSRSGVHAEPTSTPFAVETSPPFDSLEANTAGTEDFEINVPQSGSNGHHIFQSWDPSQWRNHFYNSFAA